MSSAVKLALVDVYSKNNYLTGIKPIANMVILVLQHTIVGLELLIDVVILIAITIVYMEPRVSQYVSAGGLPLKIS
jgi:hypothetical protein